MNLARTMIAAALALTAAAPAMADGGGGGGGGGPSSSAAGSGDNADFGNASSQDPAAAYQAGIAALRAQDYREAIRQLRITRRAARNDGVVNYAIGLAYVGNGDGDDARESFERAVRAENAPADAFVQLARIYLEAGRRDDAVAQQTAVAAALAACDAACGDARRADLQRANDMLTQALAPPAEAVEPAETSWNLPDVEEGRTAYTDAVRLINVERFPEAWGALQRAHAAFGPHPDVLNYMGFVSRKLGRFDDALSYYNAALRLDPNHIGAHEYLGELYIQLGQMDRAREQLARLDELCAYSCAQREELARWIETAR